MKYKTKEEIAIYAITEFIIHQQKPNINRDMINPVLFKKQACFVTVYIDRNLHGCIGDYEPVGPLYLSIMENAISAAFNDYRFKPISAEDLENLSVEVSVLTTLKKYLPENNHKMLDYLGKYHPGLLIKKSGLSALFLPQVWGQLSNPVQFLSELCQKAGLSNNDWKNDMQFWIFNIEK
jgi:uncharacterized protein